MRKKLGWSIFVAGIITTICSILSLIAIWIYLDTYSPYYTIDPLFIFLGVGGIWGGLILGLEKKGLGWVMIGFGGLILVYPIMQWTSLWFLHFAKDTFLMRRLLLECLSGVSDWGIFWDMFNFQYEVLLLGTCFVVAILLLWLGIKKVRKV